LLESCTEDILMQKLTRLVLLLNEVRYTKY